MARAKKGVTRVIRCPARCDRGWVPHPTKWGVKARCTECGGEGHVTRRFPS